MRGFGAGTQEQPRRALADERALSPDTMRFAAGFLGEVSPLMIYNRKDLILTYCAVWLQVHFYDIQPVRIPVFSQRYEGTKMYT